MLGSRKRHEAGVVEEVGLIDIHWHWLRVAKGHGHVRILNCHWARAARRHTLVRRCLCRLVRTTEVDSDDSTRFPSEKSRSTFNFGLSIATPLSDDNHRPPKLPGPDNRADRQHDHLSSDLQTNRTILPQQLICAGHDLTMSPGVERRTTREEWNAFIQTSCNQVADGAVSRAFSNQCHCQPDQSPSPFCLTIRLMANNTCVRLVGFSTTYTFSPCRPALGHAQRWASENGLERPP
jgi:hypothetical protein